MSAERMDEWRMNLVVQRNGSHAIPSRLYFSAPSESSNWAQPESKLERAGEYMRRRLLMMKALVEVIAKALVDKPEAVVVNAVEGEQVTVLELKVDPTDLGKVIGRQGRTAKSIRTILGAAGMKMKKRLTLEILE
jgi:uncharacterized protein